MVMLCKKERAKTVGNSIAGLGLIFMGLYLMKNSMEGFKESPVVVDMLQKIDIPIVLLLIGVFFTALVQSSSAITSILISMAGAGLVIGGGGNAVLFIILGSNIGSTVTAIMSSFGATRNAKRASLIHFLFNLFGSIIFFILLTIFPSFMNVTFEKWFPGLPSTQIAMFHTAFNIICTILFLPLTSIFVYLANKLIPDKEKEGEVKSYLDKRFLSQPKIAIEALVQETLRMLDLSMNSVSVALDGFINKDEEITTTVHENNENVSVISKDISHYLVEVAVKHISLSDEKIVAALHNNNGDIVRVSELADNITKYTHRSVRDNLVFSEKVFIQLKEMRNKLFELTEVAKEAFSKKDKALLTKVDEIEDTVDGMRKTLINNHIERMNAGICRPASSSVFINLVSNLERIGDHISYVAHSIDEL